jgi:type I restriction enzyme S subunit
MAKLGEVCLINPKSCTLRDDTEVSFIPMTKVGEHGEFDASEIKNYSEVKKGFTNFQNGDILFAKITPCMENGKGAIAHNMKNGIGFGSTEFHVLRPDTDKITSEWLYYLTTWKAFRKEAERNMTGSAGQKRVPKTFLENYVVNLPDIDTQKSENKILRKLDDLIFLRKQQLAKLDELIKARFVEMFGDPSNNPMGWKKQNFEDIALLITDGEHMTPQRTNKGIYLLSARNILNHTIQLDDVDYIDEEEYGRIARRIVPQQGDVLVSCSGSIGRCCVVPSELKFQMVRSVALIRFNNTINPIFAEWLIATDELQKQIYTSATQSSQANLFQGKIRKLCGYVPPLSLQNQFAAFVERVDKQKQTVQQSLEKLELMKKALMQEYFG